MTMWNRSNVAAYNCLSTLLGSKPCLTDPTSDLTDAGAEDGSTKHKRFAQSVKIDKTHQHISFQAGFNDLRGSRRNCYLHCDFDLSALSHGQ